MTDLPNISKVLESKLKKAEIFTPEELKALGAENAFIRIQSIDETACLSKLCALEGAIQGIRWHHISTSRKEELKEFFKMKKIRP